MKTIFSLNIPFCQIVNSRFMAKYSFSHRAPLTLSGRARLGSVPTGGAVAAAPAAAAGEAAPAAAVEEVWNNHFAYTSSR